MAEALDMSLGKYNKMLRLTRRSISLELPKYKSNPKDLGHESQDLLGESVPNTQMEEEDTRNNHL
jgi:DNA-directed RNA polymerase sigma subunit (sigma70/sigma32)